ncbi:MAG: GNAT family N-acetyltransferase, partial [Pseudomonadota bacterium]
AEIEALIKQSVWALARDDYSDAQIEGALRAAWGIDTQLIEDGTYFVATHRSQIIGCGGWSFRETLFGNDNESGRNPRALDPETDPAKIRAFFVRPEHARKGLGTLLLEKCESEAEVKGFSRFSLMATLPGRRLYSRYGYISQPAIQYPLADNLSIEFVPMYKEVSV